jgi:hypothetical protein
MIVTTSYLAAGSQTAANGTCCVSRYQPIYMSLINPLFKPIVYGVFVRAVSAAWNQSLGTSG